MVEVIGDLVMPSELIIPVVSATANEVPLASGSIFLSGGKLYFSTAGAIVLVTSA